MNFCKWIPKAKNGTGKLFFGSHINKDLVYGQTRSTGNFHYCEILGLLKKDTSTVKSNFSNFDKVIIPLTKST